jgi:hypothetical protein
MVKQNVCADGNQLRTETHVPNNVYQPVFAYAGSGGLDKVLTPDRERLSRRFSEGSVMSTPSYRWSRKEPVVAKLEASIAESEALCAKLNQHFSRFSDDNNTVAELNMLNMLTAQIQESQALLGVLKKEII